MRHGDDASVGNGATGRGRPRPGSAPTSGRAAAARGCGRTTTGASSARSWPSSPSTGCNVTRSFCYWPDFVPEPGRLDEERAGAVRGLPRRPRRARARRRSRRSSSATCRARTGTRPGGRAATSTATSGSSRSRPGSRRRSRAASATHPAVVGWLVSNEMPLYGGAGADRRDHGVGAARRAGGARRRAPRSRSRSATAPGASRSTGRDNGYSLRALAPLVDFVGPHVYPMEDDQIRQHLTRRVRVRARRRLRPAGRARGVRRQLRLRLRRARRRLLPAGPAHDAARRRARLDRLEQLRLRRPPRPGPVPAPRLRAALRPDRPRRTARSRSCASSRRSRELVARARPRRLGAGRGRRRARRPEHFERALPFTDARRTGRTSATTCSSRYVAAREADLPVALVRERDGIPGGGAASTSRRARSCSPARGLERLRELAHVGRDGVPLLFRGQHPEPARAVAHRGSTSSSASATHCATASSIRSRTTRSRSTSSRRSATSSRARDCSFRVAGTPSAPLVPAGRAGRAPRSSPSTRHGRPALLRHALGAGSPSSPRTRSSTWRRGRRAVNPENTWRLYSALATRGRRLATGSRRRSRACSSDGCARETARRRLRQLLGRLDRCDTAPRGRRRARSRPEKAFPSTRRRRGRRAQTRGSDGHGARRGRGPGRVTGKEAMPDRERSRARSSAQKAFVNQETGRRPKTS